MRVARADDHRSALFDGFVQHVHGAQVQRHFWMVWNPEKSIL
jgi:hypothetical protein